MQNKQMVQALTTIIQGLTASKRIKLLPEIRYLIQNLDDSVSIDSVLENPKPGTLKSSSDRRGVHWKAIREQQSYEIWRAHDTIDDEFVYVENITGMSKLVEFTGLDEVKIGLKLRAHGYKPAGEFIVAKRICIGNDIFRRPVNFKIIKVKSVHQDE